MAKRQRRRTSQPGEHALAIVVAAGALAALGLWLLASAQQPTGPKAVQAFEPSDAGEVREAAQTPILLFTLRTREHGIRVFSGQRYTVVDAEQRILAEQITPEQLTEQLPQVHAQVEGMLAADAWAGMEVSPPPEQWRPPVVEIPSFGTP